MYDSYTIHTYIPNILILTKMYYIRKTRSPFVQTRKRSCFHRAIKCVLITAQCFGLIPVSGVTQPEINRLRFKWFSFKTIYSLLVIVGLVFMVMTFILQYFHDKDFEILVSFMFFLLQSTGYVLFLILARNWHDFSRKWQSMEMVMRKYTYQPNLQRRFKVTMAILMSMALVEYVLFTLNIKLIAENCPNFQSEPVKAYYGFFFSNVFVLVSYAHWKAFLLQILSILGTFQWNFLDMFLVLLSATLAERFKQINKRVLHTPIKNEYFWKEIREDYTTLWSMCQSMNSYVCHLVSLSFGGNLFYICWQLFNSFRPITGTIPTIYFTYSFGFLVGRTVVVSIYCCWINDEGKEVLASLFNLDSQYYGPEANRLILQICSAPPALSGSNAFLVTRELCLQVAGAIFTFEIVLIQMGPAYLQTDSQAPLFCGV